MNEALFLHFFLFSHNNLLSFFFTLVIFNFLSLNLFLFYFSVYPFRCPLIPSEEHTEQGRKWKRMRRVDSFVLQCGSVRVGFKDSTWRQLSQVSLTFLRWRWCPLPVQFAGFIGVRNKGHVHICNLFSLRSSILNLKNTTKTENKRKKSCCVSSRTGRKKSDIFWCCMGTLGIKKPSEHSRIFLGPLYEKLSRITKRLFLWASEKIPEAKTKKSIMARKYFLQKCCRNIPIASQYFYRSLPLWQAQLQRVH